MTKRNHKCEDIRILLGEMLLGTLSERDEHIVEEHLLECAACRDELKELRSFYNVIGDYRLLQPDPAFSKRMKAAVFREMQNDQQPRAERSDRRLPWYKRPRLVLALSTAAAVGFTAIVYIAISPYLSGLGSEPEFGEDSIAGGGIATLSESTTPYISRSEVEMSPSVVTEEEPAPRFMAKEEESYSGPLGVSPVGVGDVAGESRAVPDKYAYWESTLGRGASGGSGGGIGTIASTSATTGDSQTSTDFDEEYLKAMHAKAESFGKSYAGSGGEKRGASGRWGSWSHPDVGIETAAIGGAGGGEGYLSMDDDIYGTLLELSPEERERVLEDLGSETEAIR